MPTPDISGSQQSNLFAALLGTTNFPAMACPVTINSQDVETFLYSGSMVTLIHKSLVTPAEISQENTMSVSCVHGDTQTYPTAALTLITTKGKCEFRLVQKQGMIQRRPRQLLRKSRHRRVRVVMVTLSVSLLVGSISCASREDMLLQLLRSEVEPKEYKDLSQLLLLKHLSESVAPEEKDVLTSIDDLDVRNEVVRELPLSQRERKAGCRNFYWKTFTSC
ncbi:putative somatostatin-1-like [Triplophysa rosa]|uniref:Somatostatin-1-like n=1 Tax=Triplophysa rosa TaxID=992332 RepID=A0A9W8CC81_TRIRA|nr:putative somatostatin-1-like [Triplophysa rosa]